jgi:AcrR family transcriptional regulator
MEATVELLLERGGPEGLSIRSITERAGVSPMALYLHFPGKEELLWAVCDAAFEELLVVLHEADAAHEGEPREQLRAIGEAYVEFALERPSLYRIAFEMPAPRGGDPEALPPDDPGMKAFEDLVRATERCLPGGRDARAVALQLWVALHGFISLRAVVPKFTWPETSAFWADLLDAHLG